MLSVDYLREHNLNPQNAFVSLKMGNGIMPPQQPCLLQDLL